MKFIKTLDLNLGLYWCTSKKQFVLFDESNDTKTLLTVDAVYNLQITHNKNMQNTIDQYHQSFE